MAPPKKERCPLGHEYSPDNSYHHPTKGGRVCRECHRTQARESARRRAALRKVARTTIVVPQIAPQIAPQIDRPVWEIPVR